MRRIILRWPAVMQTLTVASGPDSRACLIKNR